MRRLEKLIARSLLVFRPKFVNVHYNFAKIWANMRPALEKLKRKAGWTKARGCEWCVRCRKGFLGL